MASARDLIEALDERTIAKKVATVHDDARIRFHLNSNTVADYRAFEDLIAEYYEYHYTQCVAPGGRLARAEALGRAKEIIEQEYRRRRGDIVTAFNDARDGTNGGLRIVLDTIAEGLKADSVERYIREEFDRRVEEPDFDAKVDLIRDFITVYGKYLSGSIRTDQPQRYARDYQELIRAYVAGLQQTSSIFRRF